MRSHGMQLDVESDFCNAPTRVWPYACSTRTHTACAEGQASLCLVAPATFAQKTESAQDHVTELVDQTERLRNKALFTHK